MKSSTVFLMEIALIIPGLKFDDFHISTLVFEKIKLFCDKPFAFSDFATTDSSNMTEFVVLLMDFWWLKQGEVRVQNVLRRN